MSNSEIRSANEGYPIVFSDENAAAVLADMRDYHVREGDHNYSVGTTVEIESDPSKTNA